MTETDNVSTDNTVSGAIKVSGLLRSGEVTNVMTQTTNKM